MTLAHLQLPDFPLLLAPMEDVSDPPFRIICKEAGADLLYTEFISSDGLIKKDKRCQKKLTLLEEERPVGIQIFGGDEDSLAMAAAIVETHAPDFLDINFGCPVKGIVCRGAGAAVLKNIDLMVRLTKAVVDATALPVTVKTRLGWDEQSINIEEVAERLQDAGIKALTIHGRTRMQLYKGEADWQLIGKIKDNPRINIPIFGNGDVNSPQKALEYKNRYGVDGIMIGRAAIGYPWIFREIKHFIKTGEMLPAPTVAERIYVCRQHLTKAAEWEGERKAILEMRGRYKMYCKGLPGFTAYNKELLLLQTLGEVEEKLAAIGRYYEGYIPERLQIETVNYHTHLAL